MKNRFGAKSISGAAGSAGRQGDAARGLHIVVDARNRKSSTGRYTDRLIENLQKIDKVNRYTVLVALDDDWSFENKNFSSAPCRFQQFSFSPIEQIGFARQLYKLKPDLVHFTMTQQPILYFGNIITTTHDLTMFKYTRPSRYPVGLHTVGMMLYRFLFWWSHKKSKKIIVPSRYVAQDLAKRQPFTKKKTVVINEAADPPINSRSVSVDDVLKPFIFHVGAPYPHKNIARLIKAFEAVKGQHGRLQLVLPGKMKDQFKRDFDKWVKSSPERDSIIAPGFVSEPQLKWLYENASAYVLPSLSEGFGLPGLEAMAHGCPLVSSNTTCLPEIYGDAAEYFDPNSTADMAKAIEKIILDGELQKQLIKNGQKQLTKYSWTKMAKQTLKIYAAIAAG